MQNSTKFAVSIHLLCLLAASGGRPLTSGYMAGSVNTNEVVVRRLLGFLRRAGIVESRNGSGGGWALVGSSEDLTLLDVYRAVEGGSLLAIHKSPNLLCPVGRQIQPVLDTLFTNVQKSVDLAFAALPLSAVTSQMVESKSS